MSCMQVQGQTHKQFVQTMYDLYLHTNWIHKEEYIVRKCTSLTFFRRWKYVFFEQVELDMMTLKPILQITKQFHKSGMIVIAV